MVKKLKRGVLLLVLIGVSACKPDSPFITITAESDLELNVAKSVFEQDIAILNDTHSIAYNCPLDLEASKVKSGMKFASYFNLDMKKLIPTIGDLKPNYILSKKKNETFVYGIKVGDTLAFRLIDLPN